MASVIRYGSAKLFAADSSNPGSLRSFSLVSEVTFGFSTMAQGIRSIGSNDIIRESVSPPAVDLEFSYFLSDLENSERLGIPVNQGLSFDQSVLHNIQPVDIAFATDEESRDIDLMTDSDRQELKIYVIKNAYLTSYSVTLSPKGIPTVKVQMSAEDIVFKIFKNLSNYTSFSFEEDTDVINRLELSFSETGIGGSKIISTIKSFNFSMDVDYKQLLDFGQFYHKRKVNFPIQSSIGIQATTNEFEQGAVSNTFCQKNLNDFAVVYSRLNCVSNIVEEKFGMVFKGALITKQQYSMGVGEVLDTSLNFDLDIQKDRGVFFTQQVSSGQELVGEFGDQIVLEVDGESKLLLETIGDMMETLQSV